jgi:hypothetical protein
MLYPRLVLAMPAIAGFTYADPLLGPYIRDPLRAADLAIDLNYNSQMFVHDMNMLAVDQKIWVYERLADGSRQRSRKSNIFNTILEPTKEVIDAATSMGIVRPARPE